MKEKNKKERGFIKEVVLVLVALVALKYFWDIDIVGYIEGPVSKGITWIISLFK